MGILNDISRDDFFSMVELAKYYFTPAPTVLLCERKKRLLTDIASRTGCSYMELESCFNDLGRLNAEITYGCNDPVGVTMDKA